MIFNPLFSGHVKNAVILIAALLFTGGVYAAEVEVRVVDKAKRQAVDDASVCLGTSANPGQFGAWLTNQDGVARFADIPDSTLLLTVSKSGFLGYQSSKSRAQYERVFIVELPSGGLGPECQGAVAAAGDEDNSDDLGASFEKLQVQDFKLNRGRSTTRDRVVSLDAKITGNPTHYRASEYSDFAGSDWQPYTANPSLRLTVGNARKTVYFQIRRYKELGGAALESTSKIHSDSITYTSR